MTLTEKKTILEHVFASAWDVEHARRLRDTVSKKSPAESRKYSAEFDRALLVQQTIEDLASDLADAELRFDQSSEFFDWLGLVSDTRELGKNASLRSPSGLPDMDIFAKFFECLILRGDYKSILGMPEEIAKAIG